MKKIYITLAIVSMIGLAACGEQTSTSMKDSLMKDSIEQAAKNTEKPSENKSSPDNSGTPAAPNSESKGTTIKVDAKGTSVETKTGSKIDISKDRASIEIKK